MSYKTKFALMISILLWASGFVGIRAGLQEYSPEGLAFLRYLVASLCMSGIYFSLNKRSAVGFLDGCLLLLLGALGIGIYNITLNYGELTISSGMASFIISQSPLLTAIIAIIFLGEPLSVSRLSGFLISIAGVGMITLGEMGAFQLDLSLTCIAIATFVSALYSILQKPFLKKYNAVEVTTYLIWGATLFLALYMPKLQNDLTHASLHATLTVIYLGIFPAAIAYLAWSYALVEIPASRAMSFLYFMPFLSTGLGWIWLGEVPAALSLLGGLFAILGVWIVNRSYRITPQRQSQSEPGASATVTAPANPQSAAI